MKGEHTKHRQEEGEYSETKGILRTKIVTSRVTVTKIMWIFIIKKWCDSFVGPHLKEQCAVMTTVSSPMLPRLHNIFSQNIGECKRKAL